MWHLLKDMRKKDKGLAFLAVLLIAGQVFLDLKLPDYTKEITVHKYPAIRYGTNGTPVL